jgi:Domain of unknown function (DUF4410)
MKKILFVLLALSVLPLASRSQEKPCIVVKPFQKNAKVPWPYDTARMAEQTAAQLQLKLIKNFTATTEPSQACANPYLLEGEILAWHPGNRAKRVLVGVESGRENAQIRFWLDDNSGKRIFKHGDTIRAEFWGNEYANSVGQLTGPFAAKIADRLNQAKLLK